MALGSDCIKIKSADSGSWRRANSALLVYDMRCLNDGKVMADNIKANTEESENALL